jgi:decaprenyl-phosphate phosphoribosyltransferase
MKCRGWVLVAPYLHMIKFHYHLSYINVIFGALIFSLHPSIDLACSLAWLYLFFNVFLYGGIYAFNDIADINSDRLHPLKRRRPLPSGKISMRAALRFAAIMIVLGFAGALWHFGARLAWIFGGFLAINAVYSLGVRDIPVLDLIVNSLTHPLRFLMGVSLAGREAPLTHLAVIFAVAIGLVSLRRLVEKNESGWQARHTLSHYSRGELIFVQWAALVCVLALCVRDGLSSWGFFSAVIPSYLTLIAGFLLSGNVRRLLGILWTR